MSASTPEPDAAGDAAYASGVFVIWAAAAGHRQRILADLQKRFEILGAYEIDWTSARVIRNFERFYSDLEVRGVYHIFNKGRGTLTAVKVLDPEPVVERRDTSRGLRPVNVHFVEAKREYRDWTRGLEVHCGETPEETRRDVMMLLGTEIPNDEVSATSSKQLQRLARDISGADGWPTLRELFTTLNQCVRYVVLYERNRAPEDFYAAGNRPIELLTDNFHALHRILNAKPPPRAAPHGGHFKVTVGRRRVRVAIRFPGDQYFDSSWAESMLRHRVYDSAGYYRLADVDYFDTLAYHALVHQPSPARSRDDLRTAAYRLGRDDWAPDLLDSPRRAAAWLSRMLQQRGYNCPRPLDPTTLCRRPSPPGKRRYWSEDDAGWLARLGASAQRLTGAALSRSWYVRDRVLMRAQWLRSLKRMPLGPAFKSTGPAKADSIATLRSVGRRLRRGVLFSRGVMFLGRRYQCPCCGWRLRGFTGRWGLFSANRDGYCPRCNAKARHRRLWLYLHQSSDIFSQPQTLVEIAPWWSLSRRFMRMPHICFVGLDLERAGPHVNLVADIQATPLGTRSIDTALCIHVLEHVDDDRRAMSELFRMLKPGGSAIVSVPLRLDQATEEDPSIKDPAQRERLFGERGHVRYYGVDITKRLEAAGFQVQLDLAKEIPKSRRHRFGLRDDENIFHCRRPADA